MSTPCGILEQHKPDSVSAFPRVAAQRCKLVIGPPLHSRYSGLEVRAETGETMAGAGTAQPRVHDLSSNMLASLTAVLVTELKVDAVIDP